MSNESEMISWLIGMGIGLTIAAGIFLLVLWAVGRGKLDRWL